MRKKTGFTLLETLITLTVFFFVVTITLRAYLQILDIKNGIEARQTLVESSYFMLERLQNLMKNYTIDYEEYFNRRMVGCDGLGDYDGVARFTRSGGLDGSCSRFSAYGNNNTVPGGGIADTEHRSYYCSSLITANETTNFDYVKAVPSPDTTKFLAGSGCYEYLAVADGWQSFGQYGINFQDVQDDVDFVVGSFGDDDDTELGKGPTAIIDQNNVNEIYLISQNNDKRVYVRRKLVESGDWNQTGGIGDVPSDYLYTLQVLKLRGFDAGHNHDFDITNSTGAYDGKVDTWACDFQEGFLCGDSNQDGVVDALDTYSSISAIYSGYVIPLHEDDGWVNLFSNNVTVTDWNVSISPSKDPNYAWDEDSLQINPRITILLDMMLYGKNWSARVGEHTVNNFDMTVQTTFDVKSFY